MYKIVYVYMLVGDFAWLIIIVCQVEFANREERRLALPASVWLLELYVSQTRKFAYILANLAVYARKFD